MKVGDIVFAPLKDSMWPGRISALSLLAHIKFYKIKENLEVPASSLLPFIPLNVSLFLKKDSSKTFATAVKIAEGEIKKQQRRESQDSASNLSKSPKRRSQEKGVKKEPNFRVQSPYKMEDIGEKVSEDSRSDKIVKNEEDCKAEENERSKVEDDKYLPEFDSITSLLLTFSDKQLLQLVNQPSSLHQFVFYQVGTRERVKILSSPQLEVQRLTEWMLSRLLWEKEPKTVQTYQKKLTNIFSSVSFSLTSWLSRDVAKLVAMIIAHHEEQLLRWKNSKFVQVLRLFQKKLRQLLCAHQDSFEEWVPVASLTSKFLMNDRSC